MAEKMTPKGLVVGLIVDQKKTKNKGKGEPKAKAEETKSSTDAPEQAEKAAE